MLAFVSRLAQQRRRSLGKVGERFAGRHAVASAVLVAAASVAATLATTATQSGGSTDDQTRLTVLEGLDRRDAVVRTLRGHFVISRELNSDAAALARAPNRPSVEKVRKGLERMTIRQEWSCAFEEGQFADRCRLYYDGGHVIEEMQVCDGEKLYTYYAGSRPGGESLPPSSVIELPKGPVESAKSRLLGFHVPRPTAYMYLAHKHAGKLDPGSRSLRAQIEASGGIVAGEEEVGGTRCYRLEARGVSDVEGDKVPYEKVWWLSPEKSFNAVMQRDDVRVPAGPGRRACIYRLTREAGGLKKFAADLWLPTRVVQTHWNVSPETGEEVWLWRLVWTAESLEIDKPIPPETFKPPEKFP